MERSQLDPSASDAAADPFLSREEDYHDVSVPITTTMSHNPPQAQLNITIRLPPRWREKRVVSDVSLNNPTMTRQEDPEQSQRIFDLASNNNLRSPPRPVYEIIQDFVTLITVPKCKLILRELILKACLKLVSRTHCSIPFDPTATEIRERIFPLPTATEKDMIDATINTMIAAWAEVYRETIRELWERAQEDLLEQARQVSESIKQGILITVQLAIHIFKVREEAPSRSRSSSPSPSSSPEHQHVERPQTPQRIPRVRRTRYTTRTPTGPGNYVRRIRSANNTPDRNMLTVPPRTPTRSPRRRVVPATERPQRYRLYADTYRPDYSMPPPQFKIKREIP